jgi:hypothetical protein
MVEHHRHERHWYRLSEVENLTWKRKGNFETIEPNNEPCKVEQWIVESQTSMGVQPNKQSKITTNNRNDNERDGKEFEALNEPLSMIYVLFQFK